MAVRHRQASRSLPVPSLNHSGRAVVPDSEPPLNHRDRRLAAVEHDPQRLVVELVALFSPMRAVVPTRCRAFEDLLLIIGRALGSQKIAELSNLGLGNEGTVQAA